MWRWLRRQFWDASDPSGPERTNMTTSYHIRIKIAGAGLAAVSTPLMKKIHKFHGVLYGIDIDWPYVMKIHKNHAGGVWYRSRKVCGKCEGLVYEAGKLTPSDIKRLARQMKLRVTIQEWKPEGKCGGSPHAVPETEGMVYEGAKTAFGSRYSSRPVEVV